MSSSSFIRDGPVTSALETTHQLLLAMMPTYRMDTARTHYRYGRGTDFTHDRRHGKVPVDAYSEMSEYQKLSQTGCFEIHSCQLKLNNKNFILKLEYTLDANKVNFDSKKKKERTSK